MAHAYNFENFEFSPLLLPPNIDEDTDAATLRALSIYAQIEPETFDPTTLDGLNEIVDQFTGQRAFKGTERDSPLILGVANYRLPGGDADYAFIEGIAVHRSARNIGMGIFIIGQLVEVARADGMAAIEGNARRGVEPYYEKLGFDYVGEDADGVRMRLNIG